MKVGLLEESAGDLCTGHSQTTSYEPKEHGLGQPLPIRAHCDTHACHPSTSGMSQVRLEFEASLGYTVKLCLITKIKARHGGANL